MSASSAKNVRDLQTVRRFINQAIATEAPQERQKVLETAVRYVDRLIVRIEQAPSVLGAMGGKKTAERGPEYFREIAAMRKTKAGGRPKKQAQKPEASEAMPEIEESPNPFPRRSRRR